MALTRGHGIPCDDRVLEPSVQARWDLLLPHWGATGVGRDSGVAFIQPLLPPSCTHCFLQTSLALLSWEGRGLERWSRLREAGWVPASQRHDLQAQLSAPPRLSAGPVPAMGWPHSSPGVAP